MDIKIKNVVSTTQTLETPATQTKMALYVRKARRESRYVCYKKKISWREHEAS